VLEAGCGLGIEVIHLGRLSYRMVGVDYAENALRRIRAYEPGHRLAAGDVHALPCRDGVFGAYLSFGVLEHFEFGPGPALREAHRVLRPDGILVLTVPHPNLVARLVALRGCVARRTADTGPGYYETRYSVGRLEAEVRRGGFEVLERHPIGHSFTLWGLGGLFRGAGYYETSPLAERLGRVCARWLPWSTCFATLLIARKAAPA
jgi:SAM-dependent methyltransferase